jgi:hypothetical protein
MLAIIATELVTAFVTAAWVGKQRRASAAVVRR